MIEVIYSAMSMPGLLGIWQYSASIGGYDELPLQIANRLVVDGNTYAIDQLSSFPVFKWQIYI